MKQGSNDFRCRRCGKCCKENWEIIVDFESDLFRWIEQKRYDILEKIVLNPRYILAPERYNGEPQWIIDCGHVLFGDTENKCPFLIEADGEASAGCFIHSTRPEVCKRFPLDSTGRVRSDILDVCDSTIFYHSSAAEKLGLSFMEYMEQEYQSRLAEPTPPRKQELIEIAGLFKKEDLKINFTSPISLSLAEDMIEKIKQKMMKKVE